jgi:tRNA(Leu) C34 or U34 (ribose-2'-O)-methylase TrmL
MKALNHYSEAKFRALDTEARKKAVVKLVAAIEASLPDVERVCEILANLQQCALWMGGDMPDGLGGFLTDCDEGGDPHKVLTACAGFLEGYGHERKDHDMAVRVSDGERCADPHALQRANGIIVILDDLRSVFNVGSIIRTSECLGLKEIWLCGITPTPDQTALNRTAMGTADKVCWKKWDKGLDAVYEAQRQGFRVIAIETVENALSVFDTVFDPPVALLLGNESLGISTEVLKRCDAVASIPVLGWKNSLNVGVAFGVAAYQAVFGNPAGEP